MTTRTFTSALLGIIVLAALAAGAWYFFAAPTGEQLMRGHIEGTTMYPSDFVPAQRVCAQSVTNPGEEYCVNVPEATGSATPTFQITVPPGTYYLYASLKDASAIGSDLAGYKAYYTTYVTCGLRYECKDHTKLSVDITAGQTVTDIRPHDWYIP
jgi:hypothetical protein